MAASALDRNQVALDHAAEGEWVAIVEALLAAGARERITREWRRCFEAWG
jgi:hypothetical protein